MGGHRGQFCPRAGHAFSSRTSPLYTLSANMFWCLLKRHVTSFLHTALHAPHAPFLARKSPAIVRRLFSSWCSSDTGQLVSWSSFQRGKRPDSRPPSTIDWPSKNCSAIFGPNKKVVVSLCGLFGKRHDTIVIAHCWNFTRFASLSNDPFRQFLTKMTIWYDCLQLALIYLMWYLLPIRKV